MILLIHIAVALASIAYTAAATFQPTKPKLNVSYALVASTLGTGVLLVLAEPKTMVQACISGLVYFSIITFIIALVQKKLAIESVEKS